QPVGADAFVDFRVLGKGGFGEVCACQRRATGKMYANKRLNKKRLKKRQGYQVGDPTRGRHAGMGVTSVVLLAPCPSLCPHVHPSVPVSTPRSSWYHIYNVDEANPGFRFPEPRAVFYAAQILLGLEHLHQHRVVYR
ncbi:Rhodopsin kinase, partial [Opisthocomus hoazin]